MIKNIMIVEDDRSLNEGIALALENDDYRFISAFDLKSARENVSNNKIDLIILDVNLPDGNGFNFCKEVKENFNVKIIFLTANDLEVNVVNGLKMGADDYIIKPFSLMILRARVENVFRRNEANQDDDIYRVDNLVFDFKRMKFYKENDEFELSKTEQKLLKILCLNEGITLKREKLIEEIWSTNEMFVDENALSVVIKRLRNKIEDNQSKPKYIQTVYSIGYAWRKKDG